MLLTFLSTCALAQPAIKRSYGCRRHARPSVRLCVRLSRAAIVNQSLRHAPRDS